METLVGLSDKKTGKKYMFYDYVDAEPLSKDFRKDKKGVEEVSNLEEELVQYFEAHGIDSADFKKGYYAGIGKQLLQNPYPIREDGKPLDFNQQLNGEPKLYLIDIEGYSLKQPFRQF